MPTGISHFLVKRQPGNDIFTINHPPVSLSDQTALVARKAYVYRVAAVDNNGISSEDAGPDLATVRTFTTDPLPGPGLATIQAVPISELQFAVDAVRFAVGLPPAWSMLRSSRWAAGIRCGLHATARPAQRSASCATDVAGRVQRAGIAWTAGRRLDADRTSGRCEMKDFPMATPMMTKRMTRAVVLMLLCVAAVPAVRAADAENPLPPARIVPTDGPVTSTTGIFVYDPSGNVAAIGASSYVYDPMGRGLLPVIWPYGNEASAQAYGEQVRGDPRILSGAEAQSTVSSSFIAPTTLPSATGFGDPFQPGGAIIDGAWVWFTSPSRY